MRLILSLRVLVLLALGWGLTLPLRAAYPEPSISRISWEITFQHDHPKRVMLTPTGENTKHAYWYMTYMVTNNEKDDLTYQPAFDLLTAGGSIIRSDFNVPDSIVTAIKKMEKDKLDPQGATEIGGVLHPGEDQAKEGIAIWPEPDEALGDFAIFVGGLSGESKMYKKVNDDYKEIDESEYKSLKPGEALLMRKTLQLKYELTGNPGGGEDKLEYHGEKWIMR
jgi:hypothetical protein